MRTIFVHSVIHDCLISFYEKNYIVSPYRVVIAINNSVTRKTIKAETIIVMHLVNQNLQNLNFDIV